ncbi:MAG: nucleotidyltransferase domain-containing protein [Clostridiales bacterium]|jgi:predicted nucleotidyltransferase|nr:nucleotidyltransferase domain-containing protein [Clostridiales bacterium]
MAVDVEAVNTAAKDYADIVRSVMPVDKAVLFGSYAKGNATELSDVDVCFFLSDFGGKRRVEILKELIDLTRGHKDVFFEPTVFPTSEIHRGNPFVNEILQTGREI